MFSIVLTIRNFIIPWYFFVFILKLPCSTLLFLSVFVNVDPDALILNDALPDQLNLSTIALR